MDPHALDADADVEPDGTAAGADSWADWDAATRSQLLQCLTMVATVLEAAEAVHRHADEGDAAPPPLIAAADVIQAALQQIRPRFQKNNEAFQELVATITSIRDLFVPAA